jgi:hypothetical protein
MRARSVLGIVGVSLVSGVGCRPTDACAETGEICGGDPVSQWTETDACQDPSLLDMAIAKRSYRSQPIVTAGQPPPEPTSTDWCADLAYGPTGITSLNLPRDPPGLVGAYLSFQGDDPPANTSGSYGAFVTSSDQTSIEFSQSCLTRFGFSSSCAEFGAAFAAFGSRAGGVKETSCTDASDSGCLCTYTVESDAAGSNLSGRWRRQGNVLTFFPSSMVLPTQADYCVQGNHMTLWGHDRTNVMDIAGLRTVSLDRIVCGNGKLERGEQCDPPNQTTCNSMCQTVATP